MIFSATYSRLLVSGTLPRSPEVFETGLPVVLPSTRRTASSCAVARPSGWWATAWSPAFWRLARQAESQTQWPLDWGFSAAC